MVKFIINNRNKERYMAMAERFQEGDVVELKKQHPCGSKEWEILRTGMDFRIRCVGCSHQIMLSRQKFGKSVKRMVKKM